MSDKQKFKDLAGRLIAMEIELNIMEQDLLSYNEDIAYMSKLIDTLIDNITLLKKPEIITVASEYRKSIIELDFVRQKLEKITSVRNKIANRLDKLQREYELIAKEYENEYKNREKEKVVLLFRKKESGGNGQD
jgi:hypothetical protein